MGWRAGIRRANGAACPMRSPSLLETIHFFPAAGAGEGQSLSVEQLLPYAVGDSFSERVLKFVWGDVRQKDGGQHRAISVVNDVMQQNVGIVAARGDAGFINDEKPCGLETATDGRGVVVLTPLAVFLAHRRHGIELADIQRAPDFGASEDSSTKMRFTGSHFAEHYQEALRVGCVSPTGGKVLSEFVGFRLVVLECRFQVFRRQAVTADTLPFPAERALATLGDEAVFGHLTLGRKRRGPHRATIQKTVDDAHSGMALARQGVAFQKRSGGLARVLFRADGIVEFDFAFGTVVVVIGLMAAHGFIGVGELDGGAGEIPAGDFGACLATGPRTRDCGVDGAFRDLGLLATPSTLDVFAPAAHRSAATVQPVHCD